MTTTIANTEARAERHRLYEDLLAMISGTMFVSLGTLIYAKTMLTVGSSAGLALLVSYTSGWGFGPIFFLINLPFYFLAVKRMGWPFAIRTFTAVALVSVLSRLNSQWIDFSHLDPLYATVIGGGLIGTGLLMLFRHRTGLGGINILAMYLQEKTGLRAGYFQLGVDLAILGAAYLVLPADRLALSVLGAAIANLILAINHKPGRYMGLS
ncbi:YitT family protein [Rhizobium sp. AAP43]|uniref:YitT family protein n=1 Tax=Rhizobium sp. AAP43 TaxID=1523420 RepID=UPI0006B8F193|nr:YitT family protein [Rhizobium sp. AAP43]KPF45785.1 hypothetical protein IP76_06745 [Rhizobium sp. AAP43]